MALVGEKLEPPNIILMEAYWNTPLMMAAHGKMRKDYFLPERTTMVPYTTDPTLVTILLVEEQHSLAKAVVMCLRVIT
jgi:hypothetical protein